VAGQTYCLQKLERATTTVDVPKTLLKCQSLSDQGSLGDTNRRPAVSVRSPEPRTCVRTAGKGKGNCTIAMPSPNLNREENAHPVTAVGNRLLLHFQSHVRLSQPDGWRGLDWSGPS